MTETIVAQAANKKRCSREQADDFDRPPSGNRPAEKTHRRSKGIRTVGPSREHSLIFAEEDADLFVTTLESILQEDAAQSYATSGAQATPRALADSKRA